MIRNQSWRQRLLSFGAFLTIKNVDIFPGQTVLLSRPIHLFCPIGSAVLTFIEHRLTDIQVSLALTCSLKSNLKTFLSSVLQIVIVFCNPLAVEK